MKGASPTSFSRSSGGFSLMEVMVALIIGTLIVGGVMGLISMSFQYSQRIKEKSYYLPVLEAVAQQILAHPEVAENATITPPDMPGAPPVAVALAKVINTQGDEVRNRTGQLFRVRLDCQGQRLEFSIIIPQSQFK